MVRSGPRRTKSKQCVRTAAPWTARAAALAGLVWLASWQPGCRRGGSRNETRARPPKACRRILDQDLRCLDAVAAMAQGRAQAFVRRLAADLPEAERTRIEQAMAKSLAERRSDLVQTLRESLKTSFLDWCARSVSDRKVAAQVQALELCTRHSDCARYADCLGRVLDRYAQPVVVRPSARPARPAGRQVGRSRNAPDAGVPAGRAGKGPGSDAGAAEPAHGSSGAPASRPQAAVGRPAARGLPPEMRPSR